MRPGARPGAPTLEGPWPTTTRILSCLQPTGEIHLGNYLGAIKFWVEDQSPDSFHGVVDLHALTIVVDPPSCGPRPSRRP